MNTTSPLRLIALATLSLSTITLLSGCSDADSQASSSQADDHGHDHDDHSGHDHGDDAGTNSDANTLADNPVQDHTGDVVDAISSPHIYPGVLGEIFLLPVAGDPSTSLQIRHQQIPSFKSSDGSIKINSKGIAGMASMKMPFPLADGVSIEGFSIGDKIRFTFEVVWADKVPSWEVTHIEQIDANTVIDFTNKVEQPTDETP